jgi:hypothetical protein
VRTAAAPIADNRGTAIDAAWGITEYGPFQRSTFALAQRFSYVWNTAAKASLI